MSTDVVPLALLLFAVTYPSRAVGLLAPVIDKLPRRALEYLQLVGPAVLAALAAVNTVVIVETAADGSRVASFHVGVEWVAVLVCIALVAWRKNLFVGIAAAVVIVAVARITEIA